MEELAQSLHSEIRVANYSIVYRRNLLLVRRRTFYPPPSLMTLSIIQVIIKKIVKSIFNDFKAGAVLNKLTAIKSRFDYSLPGMYYIRRRF